MTATSIELARALVAELAAAGVRDFVLAPGSRSAPLAYALSDAHDAGWIRLTVRLDERGAGFMALGLSRAGATPSPVAVVTTSGTAVANLHPAVLEAAHSGDPLIVISADRPHELRGTGANQTTDQHGIFASAPRFAAEIPAGYRVEALHGVVTRAVAAALGTLTGDPGPAHLNVGFAEPLTPEPAAAARGHLHVEEWATAPLPVATRVTPMVPAATALPAGMRTVMVAGDRAGARWADVAAQAGWPLFAEPSSGVRIDGAILHYRDLLAAGLGDEIERVVVVGHPTLSRPISRLLARRDIEIVVVGGNRWTDVAGVASLVAGDIAPKPAIPTDLAWLRQWRDADGALAGAVATDGLISKAEQVAAMVWAAEVPTLVLGSSNAVRLIDVAGPSRNDGARVIANRGLAGIDGTIATASGLALGTGGPVRALIGDLTFLHDAASLIRGEQESEIDLQVVVLNDHGGAIFESLEQGQLRGDPRGERVFERMFRTPQRADIAALAAGYEASYLKVDLGDEDWAAQLTKILDAPIAGRSVVEIGLHAQISKQAARAEAARKVIGK